MIGELILVRHGKAESKLLDKSDFDRTLTEEGKREFETFMKKVVPLLEPKKQLEVWTSPLIRAKETADIFKEALGITEMKEKDFLGNGNLEGLLQALEKQDSQFVIACVGHEPAMSAWTKELTGQSTPFPKGGVVSIRFEEDKEKGRLDWKLFPN